METPTGYEYVKNMLVIINFNLLPFAASLPFKEVAAKHNTQCKNVERDIEIFINTSWERLGFPQKPTIKEFFIKCAKDIKSTKIAQTKIDKTCHDTTL